ncbi:MAG: CHAT domain-containing protein, partial [Bacteroidetes bacterium]|nr:CHAT domain-containing protein [Bacteroidota bacterium]
MVNEDLHLQLEVVLQGDSLLYTFTLLDAGEPERIHEAHPFNAEEIERTSQELTCLLAHSSIVGDLDEATQSEVSKLSQMLFDELFPPTIKELLRSYDEASLALALDENLPDIPWELLHCGEKYLGLRLAIGRQVISRSRFERRRLRTVPKYKNVLILGDPRSDLPAAYEEAIRIRNFLETHGQLSVTCLTSDIDKRYVRENLRDFDLVHFAGHVKDLGTGPGMVLTDGAFTAADLHKMCGGAPLPSLIFTNSCGSGRNQVSRGDDLVAAFLKAGVRHYLGTFWDIPDEVGRCFAVTFYQSLLDGDSVGSALLRGRRFLANTYGSGAVLWGSYVLYGDPDVRYLPTVQEATEGTITRSVNVVHRPGAHVSRRVAMRGDSATMVSSRLTTRISDLNRVVLQSIGAAVL